MKNFEEDMRMVKNIHFKFTWFSFARNDIVKVINIITEHRTVKNVPDSDDLWSY